MTAYVALLRAVNVGGTGKLPMTELKAMCDDAGFQKACTYIASGNVVFESGLSEIEVKAKLEAALETYVGRPVGVMVRTAAEMATVASDNPFSDKSANLVTAVFLDRPPPENALDAALHVADEAMALGRREIYVYYPAGQGQSKLRIPAAKAGTVRNLNTVVKLAGLAAAL